MPATGGPWQGRRESERCAACGNIIRFRGDHWIRFRGQYLDHETVLHLWRRMQALWIGRMADRLVLHLWAGGMTVHEIALDLGVRQKTVRERLQRGLYALWRHDGRADWVDQGIVAARLRRGGRRG